MSRKACIVTVTHAVAQSLGSGGHIRADAFLFARGGKLRIMDAITGRGRRACSCNAAEEPRRRGPRACKRGCRSPPSRAPRPHGRPPSPIERLFPAMIYVRRRVSTTEFGGGLMSVRASVFTREKKTIAQTNGSIDNKQRRETLSAGKDV